MSSAWMRCWSGAVDGLTQGALHWAMRCDGLVSPSNTRAHARTLLVGLRRCLALTCSTQIDPGPVDRGERKSQKRRAAASSAPVDRACDEISHPSELLPCCCFSCGPAGSAPPTQSHPQQSSLGRSPATLETRGRASAFRLLTAVKSPLAPLDLDSWHAAITVDSCRAPVRLCFDSLDETPDWMRLDAFVKAGGGRRLPKAEAGSIRRRHKREPEHAPCPTRPSSLFQERGVPVGSIQSEALESSVARRQGGFRSIDWLVGLFDHRRSVKTHVD